MNSIAKQSIENCFASLKNTLSQNISSFRHCARRMEGDIAEDYSLAETEDGSHSHSFANFGHIRGNNCQMDANLDNNLFDICTSISFVCLHYQHMSGFSFCHKSEKVFVGIFFKNFMDME